MISDDRLLYQVWVKDGKHAPYRKAGPVRFRATAREIVQVFHDKDVDAVYLTEGTNPNEVQPWT